MIERKFKIGDKVNSVKCESLGEHYKDWQGLTIILIEEDNSYTDWPYTCVGSERYPGEVGTFAEHELELAE